MQSLPRIDQASDIAGKKVFVRADIDVPLGVKQGSVNNEQSITDDTRLKDIWPTIEFLLKQNCQVILAGHLGRPEGKVVPELSSRPVAEWMSNQINKINKFNKNNEINEIDLGNFNGYKVTEDLMVLENLRFDAREEANDAEFAKELAGLGDIYVNEAFAVDERAHASVVGVPKLLPHFAGLRLVKEVEVLLGILENPKRPLLVIIGGAKLETKIPVITKMAEHSDAVVVGGKLLTEILVGSPIMAMDKVKLLKLTENQKDTVLESIDRYKNLIAGAGTIVWNGPVGMVEDFTYQVGTRRIAELVSASKAFKIIGGGDTVAFTDKLGLTDKFDWVCSGGGSMLKFLAGEELPGIKALLV